MAYIIKPIELYRIVLCVNSGVYLPCLFVVIIIIILLLQMEYEVVFYTVFLFCILQVLSSINSVSKLWNVIGVFCLRPCRIGKQFELTLLLQSVVMILTMFAMLHLCCTVQNTNRVSTKQHRLSGNWLCAKTTVADSDHN